MKSLVKSPPACQTKRAEPQFGADSGFFPLSLRLASRAFQEHGEGARYPRCGLDITSCSNRSFLSCHLTPFPARLGSRADDAPAGPSWPRGVHGLPPAPLTVTLDSPSCSQTAVGVPLGAPSPHPGCRGSAAQPPAPPLPSWLWAGPYCTPRSSVPLDSPRPSLWGRHCPLAQGQGLPDRSLAAGVVGRASGWTEAEPPVPTPSTCLPRQSLLVPAVRVPRCRQPVVAPPGPALLSPSLRHLGTSLTPVILSFQNIHSVSPAFPLYSL